MSRTLLVTGGSGFIGSALVRSLIRDGEDRVVNVDCLTYAASPGALEDVSSSPRYQHEEVDVADGDALRDVFERHRPDAVLHLAAESHVDRSIDAPHAFVRTNVTGTFHLLQEARRHLDNLDPARRDRFRFVHVSTDEVYGDLGDGDGEFTPASPYAPSSPYAATKAAADHLARAWTRTYGLPVIVTNCSNNYGPYQFPEKFIPHMVISALEDRPLPVYGDGRQVRDWLYVEDHVRALRLALDRGAPGSTYLVGGRAPLENREVVARVCELLDELRPRHNGVSHSDRVRYVEDRPGHDRRYAIDPSATERELGWEAELDFDEGLRRTIEWYLGHEDWWRRIRGETYGGERLGLGGAPPEGASERAAKAPS